MLEDINRYYKADTMYFKLYDLRIYENFNCAKNKNIVLSLMRKNYQKTRKK